MRPLLAAERHPAVDESAHGVVLRTRPLTETSLVVHWLTVGQGRVATVAKGARQPKSPFAGKTDFGVEADFTFVRSRRSQLHLLREVMVSDRHGGLAVDLGRLQQAAYAVHFIELITETDFPIPDVCELFLGLLRHLARVPPQPRTIYAFELKLLALQGLAPDVADSAMPTAVRDLMRQLMDSTWADLGALKPVAPTVRQLKQVLHDFILQHCQRVPKGRAEALAAGTSVARA